MKKEKLKTTVGADTSVRPTSKVRHNKGITLIALVITIIVMLILVAVTITMAVNGGLFGYAGKATGETQNAIDEEQNLANLESNMTVDQLIDKYTGSSGGIKAADIVGNESTYYGAKVTNYECPNQEIEEITWRIFHSDGQNIYLIASDYVVNSSIIPEVGSAAAIETIVGNYSNDANGYIIQESNLAYKWIGNDFSKSTAANMKFVAYILDIELWNSEYKGYYADYAIGGPTLKMFVDSYNATHDNDILYDEKTDYGYKVKLGDGSYGTSCSGLQNENLAVDDLYIITANISSGGKASGLHIAAPPYGQLQKFIVHSSGTLKTSDYWGPGFRF